MFGNGDDLNSKKTEGWWYTESTATSQSLINKPSGLSTGNMILQVKHLKSAGQILQFFYIGDKIYNRFYYSGSWSPWNRVYNDGILNDSSVLTPLASALGVNQYFRYSNVLPINYEWDTGIRIGKFGGGTILGIYNGNFGAEDATVSHIFAIRRSYDSGGAGGLYDIVSTHEGRKVTMTISSNNNIVLRSPCANARFLLISCEF